MEGDRNIRSINREHYNIAYSSNHYPTQIVNWTRATCS